MIDNDRPRGVQSLSLFGLHLPVFSLRRDGSGNVVKPMIYGTAFPVASGLFVTAGHVARDVNADGAPALSVVQAAGAELVARAVDAIEIVPDLDLALMHCQALAHLPPIPIDFDRPLNLFAEVTAVGFPLAIEAEWLHCIPRAFAGHVVARRELFHVSGQPPGYEVSFFAPGGLSGAPLVSASNGSPFCYGWMIEQATLGLGSNRTPVGIAVGIETLLSVVSRHTKAPLAHVFNREFRKPRHPSPKRLPDGIAPPDTDPNSGWPDA